MKYIILPTEPSKQLRDETTQNLCDKIIPKIDEILTILREDKTVGGRTLKSRLSIGQELRETKRDLEDFVQMMRRCDKYL